MQLVVNTEGGFYRHYLRVRRWYGAGEEPAKCGGLCKPCQTILWGTLLAFLISPLIGIGWLVARAFDRVIGGRGGVARCVGKWHSGGGSTWAEDFNTQEILKAPVLNAAILGLFVLVLAAAAVLLTGVLGLGAWHFSDIGAWIRDVGLTAGWWVFAVLAHIGMVLSMIGAALLRAAVWAVENRSWLAGWAVTILTPAAIGTLLSWAFIWFCLNTRLGDMLLAGPAKGFWRSRKLAAEVRKERREEAVKWPCVCGTKNSPWRDHCDWCGEERVYGPPGPMTRLSRGLSRWFRGRVVSGKMHVMGGGGIAWAFAKGLAKGACPMVEFLSPEELREKALTVAADDRAKRAKAVRRILGRNRC